MAVSCTRPLAALTHILIFALIALTLNVRVVELLTNGNLFEVMMGLVMSHNKAYLWKKARVIILFGVQEELTVKDF